MKELTPKQLKIYTIIDDFINKNGYSPTVREIMEIAGLTSPATIQEHLQKLKNKGYITYVKERPRTIRIKEKVWTKF